MSRRVRPPYTAKTHGAGLARGIGMVQLIEEQNYRAVPLLPLPDHVLLPHTIVPFHIFETRFKELAEHCVSGSRLLFVSGLMPGWEDNYHGSPPPWRIGCLAKVVNEERQPDGTMTLFVHGLIRAIVEDYRQIEPYRLANIRVLGDLTASPREAQEVGERLRVMLGELVRLLGTQGRPMRKLLVANDGIGAFTHRAAALLVADPEHRQRLLELRCPVQRAQRLMDLVGDLVLQLVGDNPPGKADGNSGLAH